MLYISKKISKPRNCSEIEVHEMINRTFRVFISSTFQDFFCEREIINNEISIKLEEYCESRGYSIQFVDLRWGVSVEAASNQKTMPICLGEVDRCNRLSPRPNFIAMIGNRYGWVPLPYAIEKFEFMAIYESVYREKKLILDKWYKLDQNAIRPEYVLLSRTGKYLDDNIWNAEESALRSIFQEAVLKGVVEGDSIIKYTKSATEQEIIKGLLNCNKRASDTITVFKIEKTDLVDKDIERLKSDILNKYQMDNMEENLICLDVNQSYEDAFKTALLNTLERNIDREIKRLKEREDRATEGSKHIDFAKDKSKDYITNDRFSVLCKYISSREIIENNCPIYVSGNAGTGKSILLAKLACEYEEFCICRFSGVTYESTSLFSILKSVMEDIRDRYQCEYDFNISKKNISEKFAKMISLVPDNEKLIIILDGINYCTDINEYNENLFPEYLPYNVKLVISSTSGCKLIDGKKKLYLNAMDSSTGWCLFEKFLEKKNRKIVNADQVEYIKRVLSKKRTAIYIYICCP